MRFLDGQPDLWLSAIVLHELHYGLHVPPLGVHRNQLSSALSTLVLEFEDRVLPVDRQAAENAAVLRVRAREAGRTLELADALVAGTAMAHQLSVATRNVSDFHDLDVEVANPWEPG